MSLAPTPKISLDKYCTIGKAEEQLCNVTNDNQRTDCYESMHAFKKIRTSTSGLRKSPNKWTKEENQKLASLVAHYGEKKWKRISAEMGGQKTGAQCAQHWKRVLSPEIRKGHWDENEEDLLLRLVVQYGSCWKKIAKRIPQRTDIQCRYQYLKAKQSREVKWDGKEDESLVKKVMEMTNCTFSNNGWSYYTNPLATPTTSSPSLSTTSTASTPAPTSTSPPFSRSPTNKENETDNRHLRSSSSSISSSGEIIDDRSSMKSSGESSGGSYVWNDNKSDVEMKDSTELPSGSGFAVNKVVWLEIAEHMARMKLTSTLRTALECKTRFLELLGGIIFSGPAVDTKFAADLKGNGEDLKGSAYRPPNDTNININIHNHHNNITITNFSNNITININNSTTNTNNNTKSANGSPNGNTDNSNHSTSPSKPPNSPSTPNDTTHNGMPNGIPVSSPISIPNGILNSHPHSNSPVTNPTTTPIKFPSTTSIPNISTNFPHNGLNTLLKTESTSTTEMSHATLLPILRFPPAAPLPQPFLLAKHPTRNIPNGLESLAAVAAILPREMLAENAQF